MKLKNKIITVFIVATIMFQYSVSYAVPVFAKMDNMTTNTQENKAIGEGTTTNITNAKINVNNAQWGSVSQTEVELKQVLTGSYFDYSNITSNIRDEDKIVTIMPNPGYMVKNVTFKTGILTGDISNLDLISWSGNSIIVKAPNLDKRTVIGKTYKIDVEVEFAPVSITTITRDVSAGGTIEAKDKNLHFINNVLSVNTNEDETILIAKPETGYLLDTLMVNGKTTTVNKNGEFAVSNSQNALVQATFIKDIVERPINLTINGQGTVKLDGKLMENGLHTLDARKTYGLILTPENGYIVQSIALNNEPINFTVDQNGVATAKLTPTVTRSIGEELKVIFAKKEIKLNKSEYTIEYKEGSTSKVEINDKLYQILYQELVNFAESVPVLPQTYDNTINIKYIAGTLFGSETWKELDYSPGFLSPNHKFGAKDTEVIRFEANKLVSKEITVKFKEIKKINSKIVLKDNLSMSYSKDAKTLKNTLYNGIN